MTTREHILQNVAFLDRDGVINRDSADYIKDWSEFEFLPNSLAALRKLKENGFTTIVITNQSVINRKMVSREGLRYIHTRMKASVQAGGGEITDIFFCPHTPEDRCHCRKPKPGLIYQAKKRYRIDLSTAVMVGDSAKDIECARNAGCRYALLVETGNGIPAEKILKEKAIHPDHVAPDLFTAVDWIITRYKSPDHSGHRHGS